MRVEEVDVITVDSFVAEHEISALSLVKIDVEGAETEVILGAINTLRLLGPDLFVEIYGGTDSNPLQSALSTLFRTWVTTHSC